MKTNSNHGDFPGGAPALEESRFEKAEIGPCFEAAIRGQFGRKLQKIFPLPLESSEPDDIQCLLREIQAKLNILAQPGEI
jgi:hypothetical protein